MTEFGTQGIDIEYVEMCLHFPYEETNELVDLFTELSQISYPAEFSNHIEEVNEEDPRKSYIIYADSMAVPPTVPEGNTVLFNITDGEHLHGHFNFEWELYDELLPVLQGLADIFPSATQIEFDVDLVIDTPFQGLNLPIAESDWPVVGIRIEEGSGHFIFQQIEDKDQTSVRHVLNIDQDLDPLSEEIVEDQLLNIRETIGEMIT